MPDDHPVFRWCILAILLAAVGISGFYRHRARRDGGTVARRAEGGVILALRAAVTLPLLAAIAAYVVHPPWMAWGAIAIPRWVRWGGVVLGLLALPVEIWVLRSIGRNISETVLTKPDHALVTHGPYRRVRHPLYSTGLCLLLAVGLMAANWGLLLFPAGAALILITVIIPREERALIARFGDAYREYRTRTGRLLPRTGAFREPPPVRT